MTILDLASRLTEQGVRPDAYCLNGGLPNEGYTIERSAGGWLIYYSERGSRAGVREFATESEACEELLGLVVRDKSTRL